MVTYKTQDWTNIDSPVSTWVPVTMERWDNLSDYNREILMTKDGIVFVERKRDAC